MIKNVFLEKIDGVRIPGSSKVRDILLRIEPFIFLAVVLASLWPIYKNPLTLSLDGSAHVYNASIIKDLLFSQGETFGLFYSFNPMLVPNWGGHVLLVFLQLFVSPAASEGLFLAVVIAGTAYAFRYLVKSVSNAQIVGSYLIFLTFYNHFYLLGFYNFLFSFIPAFILMGYLLKNVGRMTATGYVSISLLLCATFFSHGFVYLVSLATVVCILLLALLRSIVARKDVNRQLKESAFVSIAIIPSLILMIPFVLSIPELDPVYLPVEKVWEMFSENASMILFTREEVKHTQPLLIGILFLVITAFFFRFKKREAMVTDVFALMLFGLLIMVFVWPDFDGWNGYYTMRSLVLLITAMILWVAVTKTPLLLKVAAIVVMGYFHWQHLDFYMKVVKEQQNNLASIMHAGDLVPKTATIIAYENTGHWLFSHMPERASAVNGAVQTTNYEASLGYFPLHWRSDINWAPTVAQERAPIKLFEWVPSENPEPRATEYILVIGRVPDNGQEHQQWLKKAVESNYIEIFSEEISHLYQLKK